PPPPLPTTHPRPLLPTISTPTPPSTPFPYTTLFRSPPLPRVSLQQHGAPDHVAQHLAAVHGPADLHGAREDRQDHERQPDVGPRDRKSTRLNSSHLGSSYAVFCLKKKINATDLVRSA